MVVRGRSGRVRRGRRARYERKKDRSNNYMYM